MLRLHRWLAGTDGPGKRALPAGEFLHPVPLAALALLALNDHVLKGAGVVPGAVTGKLSDVMGVVFFPVLCTAVVDTALWGLARAGVPVDFSLRRWKLAAGLAVTAGLMAAIKLSPGAAGAVADALGWIGFPSQIVVDGTDLFALPALVVPWWVGRAEIRRVPLGRIEALERAWRRTRRPAADGLRDVPGAEALAAGLERYWTTGDGAAAGRELRALRERKP
jgi:hypothetical protein